MNLALVAKLGWQFLHCLSRLWVRIASANYNNHSPINAQLQGGNYSAIWRGILQAAPLLKVGLCLWPRNGSTVRLRDDPWLLGGVHFQPRWRDGVRLDPSISMVKDLVHLELNVWNANLLRDLFEADSVAAIMRLPVPNSDAEDSWLWTLEKEGLFSVKSLVVSEQLQRAPLRPALDEASWG